MDTLQNAAATRALDTPLVPLSRADEITDRLVTAITIGEYLPGSRLPPERELAASLHVGRMTVRAALARLVEHGLLETQRGRGGGSFVRSPQAESSAASPASVHRTLSASLDAKRDLLEAVGRLQGAIARAAAEKRSAADVDRLHERMASYRAAKSGRESQRADALLHMAIIEAAHNDTLSTVLLDLESRISINAPAHVWGRVDGMRAMELRALTDHENLVAAICEQRPTDAGTIALEHARLDLEMLEEALSWAGPQGRISSPLADAQP